MKKLNWMILILMIVIVFSACGKNDKQMVIEYFQAMIQYAKSNDFQKNSDIVNDLEEVRKNFLGKNKLGEMEFAMIMDKYENYPEIRKLKMEFDKAFSEAQIKKYQKK